MLEDTLVRFDVAYQVIGGTKFYERAEIKDALAYLSLLTNPADTVVVRPRDQLAAARDRADDAGGVARVREHDGHPGDWRPPTTRPACRGLAPPLRSRRSERFASVVERLRELAEHSSVGELLESTLQETGYLEALEAERTIEAQGRLENLHELIGVGREFDDNWEGERGLAGAGGVPPAALAVFGAGRRSRTETSR